MILKESEAAVALCMLLDPDPEPHVLYHDGRRYGGFRGREHAEYVARAMGWDDAVILGESGGAP